MESKYFCVDDMLNFVIETWTYRAHTKQYVLSFCLSWMATLIWQASLRWMLYQIEVVKTAAIVEWIGNLALLEDNSFRG